MSFYYMGSSMAALKRFAYKVVTWVKIATDKSRENIMCLSYNLPSDSVVYF